MKVSKNLLSELGMPRATSFWRTLAKLVTARFVRGNTAAQFASILYPKEQAAQRDEAERIAERWEREYEEFSRR